jgi:hypothetical protein
VARVPWPEEESGTRATGEFGCTWNVWGSGVSGLERPASEGEPCMIVEARSAVAEDFEVGFAAQDESGAAALCDRARSGDGWAVLLVG